jgi:hypothetical protein
MYIWGGRLSPPLQITGLQVVRFNSSISLIADSIHIHTVIIGFHNSMSLLHLKDLQTGAALQTVL